MSCKLVNPAKTFLALAVECRSDFCKPKVWRTKHLQFVGSPGITIAHFELYFMHFRADSALALTCRFNSVYTVFKVSHFNCCC